MPDPLTPSEYRALVDLYCFHRRFPHLWRAQTRFGSGIDQDAMNALVLAGLARYRIADEAQRTHSWFWKMVIILLQRTFFRNAARYQITNRGIAYLARGSRLLLETLEMNRRW